MIKSPHHSEIVVGDRGGSSRVVGEGDGQDVKKKDMRLRRNVKFLSGECIFEEEEEEKKCEEEEEGQESP